MKNKSVHISKGKELLVIWPSDDAVEKRSVDGLDHVLSRGEALGYAGSYVRAQACEFVIITSGPNRNPRKHFKAEIVMAKSNSRLLKRSDRRPYPAFDLYFKKAEIFKSEILDKHTWGSRNIRYWVKNKIIKSSD